MNDGDDLIGDMIAEVARSHGVAISRDDPIVAVVLLAVTGLDLGAVWIGIYPRPQRESHVRKGLGIPDEVRVLCLVAAGHPAETKLPRTQYDESRVHYDQY